MNKNLKKLFASLILATTLFTTGCSYLLPTPNETNSNVVSVGTPGEKYEVSQEEKDYLKDTFNYLTGINPETVGYINIPGTKVDEPIVKTTNNDTYLDKSFEGAPSELGAIFMDMDNSNKFNDKLTWVFGHVIGSKLNTNRMFKDLMNYQDQKFFDEHKYVVVETPERKYYYEAQLFMVVPEDTDFYLTEFESETEFKSLLDEIKNLDQSSKKEKILTRNSELSLDSKYNYLVLSTCLDFNQPGELRYNLYLKQIPDSELTDFLEKNKDKLEYTKTRYSLN